MPRISVIMSAHNAEKYIKEAIDSILNQSFKDFEFIIIDDGSDDSTKGIILSYSNSKIRLVENKKNLGLITSLNKGLKIAKGEYIARMDADDISLPQRLKKQAEFLDRNRDIAVLGSWIQIIDARSKEGCIIKHNSDPVIIKWMQIFKNQIAHPSSFFRKKAIDEVGHYRKKYKYAEDYDLWSRVLRKYKVVNLPEVLVKYRVHSESVCGNLENRKIQNSSISRIIFNNINFYINLNNRDFKILNNAFKNNKILSFKSLIKVIKIYKNLFNSYVKKENLNNLESAKIYQNYKEKRKALFRLYLRSKFYKN